MPTYTTIPVSSVSEDVIDTFGGYNHTLKIADGEFYDMTNLTSDYFPLMGNRANRSVIAYGKFAAIYGMIADASGNLFVVGKMTADAENATLYKIYRGTDGKYETIKTVILTYGGKTGIDDTLTADAKQMMFYSNRIVIYPDRISIRGESYESTDTTEKHEFQRLYKSLTVTAMSEAPVKFTPCKADGEEVTEFETGDTAPEEPEQGDLWLDTSSTETGAQWKKYLSKTWSKTSDICARIVLSMGRMTEEEIERECFIESGDTAKISFTDPVFSEGGDATLFEGEKTPTARVIHKTDEETNDAGEKTYNVELILVYVNIVTAGFEQTGGSITFLRDAPKLDYVVQTQNRIWGCRYSYEATEEAEDSNINEIYACKLGDETRWSTFRGVSTDSYTASIGTQGAWTGAASIGGNPVFFKENCYHKVYVSTSGAHQIVDKTVTGVQSGCGGSVMVINDICYYKSRGGVVAFDGTDVYDIGAPLGDVIYTAAEGGSAKSKYYLSLKDAKGRWAVFVYDPKKGLWHKEDSKHALAFYSVNNETFFATEDSDGYSINLISDYTTTDVTETTPDWEAVTGLQGYNYVGQKYISRFNLRMKLPKGSSMDIYIEYDSSGRWEKQGHIEGKGTTSFLIPVKPRRCDHFRVKLTGRGEVRVYSLSKNFEGGADKA